MPYPDFKNEILFRGYVESIPRINITNILVAIAPILLFIPLYFLFEHSLYLAIELSPRHISIGVDKDLFLTKDGIFTLYCALQLINGSKPSIIDWKLAIKTILSKPFGVNKHG